MAHADLVAELSSALRDEQQKATFAIGGTLPVILSPNRAEDGNLTPVTQEKVSRHLLTTKPVNLRFGQSGSGYALSLPISTEQNSAFVALLNATQPAEFGIGSKSVFDETYRKASQLDPSDFCTDFSPYETGIIDIINQALVPDLSSNERNRAVRAELYKLNVYSGPSGHFKAHVDTPRSDKQIGSLVVCLPCPFEGGSLSVRNHGTDVLFDWSATDEKAPSIQWAAFYSDCEHEVHEVTAGHRITLTYNLYISPGTGLLTRRPMNMDPKQSPLYALFDRSLRDSAFMPEGGTLGVYLSHHYPHTDDTLLKDLPYCLKGVDMMLYETLRAIRLGFKLTAITAYEREDDVDYDDYYDSNEDDDSDEDNRKHDREPPIQLIYYNGFMPTNVNDSMFEHRELKEHLRESGKPIRRGDVTWITPCKWKGLQEAFIAYGNNPSMGATYSSAAILVSIPKASERGAVSGS